MHPLEIEIENIENEYKQGNLSKEERDYLLTEIQDVRAANECAGDEVMFRHIVSTCNILMSLA